MKYTVEHQPSRPSPRKWIVKDTEGNEIRDCWTKDYAQQIAAMELKSLDPCPCCGAIAEPVWANEIGLHCEECSPFM